MAGTRKNRICGRSDLQKSRKPCEGLTRLPDFASFSHRVRLHTEAESENERTKEKEKKDEEDEIFFRHGRNTGRVAGR